MPHVVHYEDDFFIVDGLVRVICDASKLELDPDIIGEAVLSTVRLADTTLRRIKDLVLQKEHLVDRPECLRLLARTTLSFADALSELLRPGAPLFQSFSSSSDEMERISAAHKAAAAELKDALRSSTAEDASPEDHVSGDELSELLRI